MEIELRVHQECISWTRYAGVWIGCHQRKRLRAWNTFPVLFLGVQDNQYLLWLMLLNFQSHLNNYFRVSLIIDKQIESWSYAAYKLNFKAQKAERKKYWSWSLNFQKRVSFMMYHIENSNGVCPHEVVYNEPPHLDLFCFFSGVLTSLYLKWHTSNLGTDYLVIAK